MRRIAAQAIGLTLLAGCGSPPSGTAPRHAPPPTDPAARATDPPMAATVALRADLPRLEPMARFQLSGRHVRAYERSVQLSADGKRVAFGCDAPKDGSHTQVWQLGAQPKVILTSPVSYGGGVFALSPGGTRLLISGTVSAEAFDVDTGKSLGHPTNTYRFSHAFFRDESVAVWTQRSHEFNKPKGRKVYVWDVVKNADAGTFEIADDRFEVAYPAKDGAELWLFQSAGRFEIECYDVAAGKLARIIKPDPDVPGKPFTDAGIWNAVAPDGSTFASHKARTRIYDGTGKCVGQLPEDVYGLPEGLLPGGSRYLAQTSGSNCPSGRPPRPTAT